MADRIFADFCTRVGIASIRDYENREMRIKQEMEDKLRSFDDDIQKLAYEIDFVTEQDGNRKVEVEKEKVRFSFFCKETPYQFL